MKVLIIAPNSLRYCPYAFFYINLLKQKGIDFDVAYADRYALNEQYDFNTAVFNWDKSKSRLSQFYKYRKFLSKLIKTGKYDKAVALTTLMAVLLNDILAKRFKDNYIVDVRDFTYENYGIYRYFEKKAIKKSRVTVISSDRFRDFLPEFDYTSIYNVPENLESDSTFTPKKEGDILKISYVGSIAYTAQCEKLLRLVEKDDRFRFELHGNDMKGDYFEKLIKAENIKNTRYFGAYLPEEKADIVKACDVLFNAYGNGSPLLLCALSNKLTDAAIFKKAVLNSPNTFMHQKLDFCSFASDLNDIEDLDRLYNWYLALDGEKVDKFYADMVAEIKETNKNAVNTVLDILK